MVARLIVAVLLGLFWARFAYLTTGDPSDVYARPPVPHHDFAQMWFAAKTILRGGNPYALMGPGNVFDYDWPWYYPLPAGLAAIPVAPFSEAMAIGIMVFLGAACFAWALTATGWWPLLAFGSICTWQAFHLAQWSPLLASALVLAPVGALLVVKPTIGAAIFVARPSWWAVIGGLVLLAAAFAVQPSWLTDWREALAAPIRATREAAHTPPILYPGGFLVLAAVTRWRRPEARLLVALASVPQTTLPYEAVALFLIPRGAIESGVLVGLSWAVLAWVKHYDQTAMGITVAHYGTAFVWLLYLPCVLMVLRRPNEGPVPAWIETRLAALPAWIRGRAPMNI